MPKTSKSKGPVPKSSRVVAVAAKNSEDLTLEQRKKQAEEPIYLNRM